MTVPFADVASRIVTCSLSQELCEECVCPDVVANVSVGGRSEPVDDQGMGNDDIAVLSIAKEDATGLQGQMLRGLGRDGLVCVVSQFDACRWSSHRWLLSAPVGRFRTSPAG